ncbi:membrane dipeptidase [Nocardia vulneris]|uniref:dipeptidase n=1 Tax=Nocardia vulneris TaxID=1141657 RepID=UPI0030CFD695
MTFQGPCSPDVWTDELRAELRQSCGEQPDYVAAGTFLVEKAMAGTFDGYRALFDASGATTGLTGCMLRGATELLADAVLTVRMCAALPWLRPVRTAQDIRDAHADHEHALLGMCQLNLLEPGNLDLLDNAAALGLAHTVDCAYNTQTFIGAGCTERNDPGLSHFGVRFVQRCNEIGVIVDTAHSGRQTTLDACRFSARPVIATHTSASALYEHHRAKSDDEIRAIADTGGIIGVLAVPSFLAAPDAGTVTIELVLDHIDYIATLVGVEHVGIGTDWPLALPDDVLTQSFLPLATSTLGFRAEHALDTRRLDGFRDYRDLVNITRGLVQRGYSDQQIEGILGENFLRILQATVG